MLCAAMQPGLALLLLLPSPGLGLDQPIVLKFGDNSVRIGS